MIIHYFVRIITSSLLILKIHINPFLILNLKTSLFERYRQCSIHYLLFKSSAKFFPNIKTRTSNLVRVFLIQQLFLHTSLRTSALLSA